jgi:integrase
MSRRAKGPRLWLEPEERDADGKLVRHTAWVIRDGGRKCRTGCAPDDREGAERALAEFIAAKYQPNRNGNRHPDQILVLDVLNIYATDVVKARDYKRPEEAAQRLLKLGEFWQSDSLGDVNGKRCREYVAWRTRQPVRSFTKNTPRLVSTAAPRRELEDLRAAINHHRQEGLCSEVIGVTLPEKSRGRDTWLTRPQAARLIWAAWRAKQIMGDKVTERDVGKHVARFILIGLYTGTRHAAICGAAFQPAVGRGYVDLDRGVFYRRPREVAETKKRQPPAPLADRLLAHLRRWQRRGIATNAVVEWNGKPVRSVRKGFAAAVTAAGLPTTGPDRITPHVLRHTSATWGMQQGGDLWQIAGFLGMSVELLQDRYGHHHPDHQRGAAEAISRSPGQVRDRMTGNKRGQTPTNATKIAVVSGGER